MTFAELRQQIEQQYAQAQAEEDAARAALRRAELASAELRGQLIALARIQIEERPIYTEGQDAPPAG